MSLSSFVAQQELAGTLILNFRTNLKKTGREKLTVPAYENRLTLLDNYWKKFSDRHESVVTFSGYQDSDYLKEDYFSKVEDAYVDVRSYIQEQITQMSKRAGSSTAHAETSPTTTAAKLPKFILPIFTGDFLEWESFKDLFISSVHKNKSFSDATRLQYLLAQVSGDAAELIRDIKITDQNYAPAWEILSRRYDNQRLLVKHHFRHLLSLSQLTTESADSLRKLLDKTNRTRRALQNLGRPVEGWDDWFVHLTVDRLPPRTHRDWESAMGNKTTVPSWEELNDFIVGRIHSLEAVLPEDTRSKATSFNTTSRRKVRANLAKIVNPKSSGNGCSLCNERHYIGYCPTFKRQSPQKRRETAVRLKLCTNCLREHPVSQCASASRCTFCQNRHHSLLHQNDTTPSAEVQSAAVSSLSTSLQQNHTLLATALVKIHGFNGRSTIVRALLDQGSEATFLSENVAQQLRLPRVKVTVPVLGIGASHCGTVKSMVRVRLTPVLEEPDSAVTANAYIMPNLSESFQPRRADTRRWKHLDGLQLSDPSSQRPAKIDLVIGADIYGYTLLDGLVKGPPGTPVAQRTVFGWVLSGMDENSSPGERPVNTLHCSLDLSLGNELRRFWEIEEIPSSKALLTPDDEFCERHFQTTHTRAINGRFIVRLPRRSEVRLGDSKLQALRAFHKGELQRRKDPALDLAYRNFMEEYIRLGHMKPISEEVPATETFYLPHHAVWKREGDKNKIRVVFNASAPTTSGHSLNDALFSGPKLQQDLGHILLRWRKYAVVFSADIVKMFRQIQVDPADQPLQRVFWRNSPAEELQEYQLQTVTYGTACAPFLAIRTLLQLATEGFHHLPKASSCLRQQTYVDDILTGTDTLDEARELKRQLVELLMAGGFELAKWASNSEEFAPKSRENHILSDGTVKTLGLHWNPAKDVFGFQVQLENLSTISKRRILSSVSRLFDPLGWLAPVVVKAKILLQDLWTLKIDWDAAPTTMGQLPASRVTPSRPFLHCGLDYAGPLILRPSKGRSRVFLKGYVALFVCMSTRAIHLEAVSDYSTAAFLAAFKRFVSRRGIPATLCSDQATNFKGADAELKSLFTQASAENNELADLLATDGTQWNFIPPHSPHFGGIWEAGVKSVKGHLKRVLGNTRLTFEELSTVLSEIEACLNSRPISPISSSPQDLVPLTPGHFLIGSAPKTLPEPSLSSTPINRLSRWQLLRRLYEDFWRRWSREYLHHLHQRQKWTTTADNLQPDDLVLIQDDNLPPAKWRLGRIVAVHPGADGIVRVVTVRTATSTFRRAAAKLRRLPLKGATGA